MNNRRVLVAAALTVLASGAPVLAQPAAAPVLNVSIEQRADALIGLGRVARERGDWAEAHRRFSESAQLRVLPDALLQEHFWIAAHADHRAAVGFAARLEGKGQISADVYASWIALTLDDAAMSVPLGETLLIVERAAAAFPRQAGWTTNRAAVAMRAERAGETEISWRAWARVSPEARASRSDWQGSYLRVAVSRSSRARMASELDRYVSAFPGEEGMRRLAVEAWADAGEPLRALRLLTPLLDARATPESVRRAADLARQGGADSQARSLMTRLLAMPGATDQDTWTLAALLAASRDTRAVRALLAASPHRDDRCLTHTVDVALASGDDTLLADLVPALPETCPNQDAVATRVARIWVDRGRPSDAEAWLAPLVRAGRMGPDDRLVLARALETRRAWDDMETTLAPVLRDASGRRVREAARMLAWSRHARGRTADAWELADRLGAPGEDVREAQAGWAGLALAAGDSAAADRLARAALGTTGDVQARAVLASIDARAGRPANARVWLDPVEARLTDPGHLAIWLDAVEATEGVEAAWTHATARDVIVSTDASLLARLAVWDARLGHRDAAVTAAGRVAAIDPDLGARVRARIAMASGEADEAWALASGAVAPTTPAVAADWLRLRLEAALATGRWQEAEVLLHDAASDLNATERVLAGARLSLGRDDELSDDQQRALTTLATGETPLLAARLVLAQDALVRHAAAEALRWTGVRPEAASSGLAVPVEARSLAAEALLALGRPAEVLRITDRADEPAGLQLARARALVALGRADEAAGALQALARSTGRADAFAAWAETTADPASRVTILDEAVKAHPGHLGLQLARADALRLAGSFDLALEVSERLTIESPASREAWRIRLATLAAAEPARLTAAAVTTRAALGDDADARLLIAEAAAGAAHVPAPAVDAIVASLMDLPPSHRARAARAEATIAVTGGDWALATEALARLEALRPDDPEVLRLQAHVTAWSGAHEASLPLFARYLATQPDDQAAWRQYARVLTWLQRTDEAAAAYARVEALAPTPGLAAEARTRLAVVRRDWPEAALAAREWRTAEPSTLDALVDLALSLDQSGDAPGAASAYAALARWPGLPVPVQRTVDAYQWRRAPHGRIAFEVEHSDGFEGQRLLERRESMLGGDVRLTAGGAWETFGHVGQGTVTGTGDDTGFTQGLAGVRAWFGRGGLVEASLGATGVDGATTALGAARVALRLTSALALDVSTARRPVWENMTTVHSRLQGWTTGARLRLLGHGPVEASAGAEATSLSDGNERAQVDVGIARQFGAGARQFEVRGSAFLFGFERSSGDYFSPSTFGRADLEVGVTRWMGRGAVVRDGRFAWRGRAGAAVDTDGLPYLLVSSGAVLPVSSWVGVAGDARWTSSRRYRAWSATVGLQVGMSTPVTRGATR